MAGQYKFKDTNGNVVSSISGSNTGVISFSGSLVDFSNTIISGTISNSNTVNGLSSSAFVFTSSFNTISSSVSSQLTTLQVTSGSNIGRLNNLESKSSSVDISISNINSVTASNIARLNNLESKSSSVDISITNINSVTASNIARLSNLETKSASIDISVSSINTFTSSNGNTSLNTFTASNNITSLNSKTGSYATTGSNTFFGTQTYSGSVYIANDLVVQGSSSIQYISASSVSIGTNIVQLNTANPSVRFAGLTVIDSGSIGGSGSFLYDSVEDEFIFVHRGNGTNVTSSHFIMGPETFDNLGNETYLTCNIITKGTGKEHLVNSCIFDNGTTTCIKNNLVGTGTITGTTIYGSTAVCSPVGKFTTCIDAGSGTFSGQLIFPTTSKMEGSAAPNFILASTSAAGSGVGPYQIFKTNNSDFGYIGSRDALLSTTGNMLSLLGLNGLSLHTGASYNERFSITSTGIATFACQVCAPSITLSANDSSIGKSNNTGYLQLVSGVGAPSGTSNFILYGCANVGNAGNAELYADNIRFGAATSPYAIRACIGSSSNWFACATTFSSTLRVGGANGNFLIDSYTTSKIGIRSWTDIAGTTNNFFVQNNANYNYGIVGVVSATGTATGDVYGLGYSPSAGTSMTPVLNWTSAGLVGIGTCCPAQSLEVNGSILASVTGKIGFRYSSGNGNYYSYLRSATNSSVGPIVLAGGFESAGASNEAIRFVTNDGAGNERCAASILNSGRFGIATIAPSTQFQIRKNYWQFWDEKAHGSNVNMFSITFPDFGSAVITIAGSRYSPGADNYSGTSTFYIYITNVGAVSVNGGNTSGTWTPTTSVSSKTVTFASAYAGSSTNYTGYSAVIQGSGHTGGSESAAYVTIL